MGRVGRRRRASGLDAFSCSSTARMERRALSRALEASSFSAAKAGLRASQLPRRFWGEEQARRDGKTQAHELRVLEMALQVRARQLLRLRALALAPPVRPQPGTGGRRRRSGAASPSPADSMKQRGRSRPLGRAMQIGQGRVCVQHVSPAPPLQTIPAPVALGRLRGRILVPLAWSLSPAVPATAARHTQRTSPERHGERCHCVFRRHCGSQDESPLTRRGHTAGGERPPSVGPAVAVRARSRWEPSTMSALPSQTQRLRSSSTPAQEWREERESHEPTPRVLSLTGGEHSRTTRHRAPCAPRSTASHSFLYSETRSPSFRLRAGGKRRCTAVCQTLRPRPDGGGAAPNR